MKIVYKKKAEHKNECDCAGADIGGAYNSAVDFHMGMGEVNPMGGPDKFGPIFGDFKPKRKFRRKRK